MLQSNKLKLFIIVPVLSCLAVSPQARVIRPKTKAALGRLRRHSSGNGPGSGPSDNQEQQKQNQEYAEQDFGYRRGSARDTGKAEQRRDNRNH